MDTSKWLSRAALIALTLSSGQAVATVYNCVAPVGHVSMARSGDVFIESFAGSSWIMLCSMSTTANGTTPEQCKSVYALLLAAQTSGRMVRLWFNDNLTCATQPSWTYATGWYFGPDLMD